MKFRMIPALLIALVVGLATLAPVPAYAQRNGTLQVAQFYYGASVPATDQQIVRVTFGSPYLPGPEGGPRTFVLELDHVGAPVTIGPGESFTYTLDPREVGVLVDPVTGLRHVRVSGRITAVASDPSDSRPVLLIEILNARTGKLESFHAFPGFAGGVSVATGDVN